MAVISSTKDFWMHPNGLTFDINYFGNPQLIQTSLLAGAVILAYRKDIIGYNAAHNFREWKLQAFPTQLSDTCAYYVHVELSRTGNTAMVIYSPVIRDMQGRTLLSGDRVSGTYDDNVSADSWFIYIGTLSASVDSDGNTVERTWTDGVYTGTLATDQYRMEEASGDWVNMFSLNGVTGFIDVLKTISKATINALTVAKEFIFGGKTLTGVAGASDTLDQSKVNDATLPTTGYTKKYVGDEIEALDDHFLIKDDPDNNQSVAGPVTFEQDVTVQGNQSIGGNQTIEGEQEVVGLQTLHDGFKTANFNNAAGQINGAQLTRGGFFSVAGLEAMSLTVKELIYNVIRAQGGEYVFSPSATIEHCEYVIDNRALTVKQYYEEYSHTSWPLIDEIRITLREDESTVKGNPFRVKDIIYGYVNNIGESGQYAVGGQSIMHITSIDGLNITAELYDSEHGVTANIPPADGMTIAQRGSESTSDRSRLTSFYLSTQNGSLMMLDNVTTPTISHENYAAIFGKLPQDLYDQLPSAYQIQAGDPIVYAKNAIFENFVRFDHEMKPIQDERNRGAWVSGVTYENNSNYYDVVTYEGQLWKCLKTTVSTTPPFSGNYWLLLVAKGPQGIQGEPGEPGEPGLQGIPGEKGEDAKPVYWLYTNVSNVHVSAEGEADTDAINVSVFKSDSSGVVELTTQEQLEAEGLQVQYSIDSTAPRQDVYLEDKSNIMLEDGSGEFIGESDDQTTFITTEGEAIDLSEINYYIMFWLKDVDGDKDLDSLKVEVVRDGLDGLGDMVDKVYYAISDNDDAGRKPASWSEIKPAVPQGYYLWTKLVYAPSGKEVYSTTYVGKDGETGKPIYIHSAVSSISINTALVVDDNGNKTVRTVEPYSHTFDVALYYDGQVVEPSSYSVAPPGVVSLTPNAGRFTLTINIAAGTNVENIPSDLLITMSFIDGGSEVKATRSVMIVKSQRGLDGPQGEAGPLFIMKGTWSKIDAVDKKYDVLSPSAARPMVWYVDPKDNSGAYYIHDGNNDLVQKGFAPNVSNSGWRWATNYTFELLLANFAKLGNKYGGVFYGKYLFSQYGRRKGVEGSQPYTEDMFDATDPENPILNDSFTPNLFLDFLAGSAKFGKLSESFIPLNYTTTKHEINIQGCHNVRYDALLYKSSDGTQDNGFANIVIVPSGTNNDGWAEDGTHCTIVHGYDMDYSQYPTAEQYRNAVVAVCADEKLLERSNKVTSTNFLDNPQPKGWFIWKNYRTKVIFLAPGAMLKLRSVKTGENDFLWFVENSGEFEILDTYIKFHYHYTDGTSDFEAIESKPDVHYLGLDKHAVFVGSPILNDFEEVENSGYTAKTIWEWDAKGDVSNDGFGNSFTYYLQHA